MHTSPVISAPPAVSDNDSRTVEAIADMARWAPSGDNTQPWAFQIAGPQHLVVHGNDTRDHCVYDLDGRPSQMSIGALIETAAIAASAHGWRLRCTRRTDMPDTMPTFDLAFSADPAIRPDALLDVVQQRSVQRRPYATTPLTPQQKTALEAAVGAHHTVRWLEGRAARQAMAGLLFRSARLRLTTPEAYRVHRDVIQWDSRFSADKVPDQALGVNGAMLAMMRFGMHSWERVHFFNRFMAGTWMPRIQMDWLPALACGAHFVLLARKPPLSIDDNVEAGRAVQRFWLTATRLGLMLQPELTPLIFARYAEQGREFSSVAGTLDAARRVAQRMKDVLGADVAADGVFIGRIGHAPAPTARSVRKELRDLLWRPADR